VAAHTPPPITSPLILLDHRRLRKMHDQTSNMTSPIDLPLVDISSPDRNAAGKAMLHAAVKYGFLYIDSRTTAFTKNDVESAFDLVSHL